MSPVQNVHAASSAAPVAPKKQAVKPETAAQEAQETAAVTKAEARKGDPQAIRRLAQSQAAKAPKAESAPVPAKEGVNVLA